MRFMIYRNRHLSFQNCYCRVVTSAVRTSGYTLFFTPPNMTTNASLALVLILNYFPCLLHNSSLSFFETHSCHRVCMMTGISGERSNEGEMLPNPPTDLNPSAFFNDPNSSRRRDNINPSSKL